MNLIERRRQMMAQGGGGEPNYLRFTATQDSSVVKLDETGTPPALNLEYRVNGGTWIPYTYGTNIALDTDDYVEMRKSDAGVATQLSSSTSNYRYFSFSGQVGASGNIMSLLDKTAQSLTVGNYCFYFLFHNAVYNTRLISAPLLPATMLGDACYQSMFQYTAITEQPNLPATTLSQSCYTLMFAGCQSITSCGFNADTVSGAGCCSGMFKGCTGIVSVTALPNLAQASSDWRIFRDMFNSCTGLTSVPILYLSKANGYEATRNMFYGCNRMTSYHVDVIKSVSENMFYNNSSCEEFIIDATTPPTIASTSITGLKADCIIYVPDNSVNDYKAKQYWSDRAAYIKGISEKP